MSIYEDIYIELLKKNFQVYLLHKIISTSFYCSDSFKQGLTP